MADGRRFGDGMAAGPDLEGAAEVAVGQALAPLEGARPDLLCVFVAPGAGHDPEQAVAAGRRAMELGGARTDDRRHGQRGDRRRPRPRARPRRLGLGGRAARCADHALPAGGHPRRRQPAHRRAAAARVRRPRGGHARRPLHVPHRCVPRARQLRRTRLPAGRRPGRGRGRGRAPTASSATATCSKRGGVGVVLGGEAEAVGARAVVSQGCRPIGPAMIVTRAERNLLLELAGQPAYTRLVEIVSALPPAEQEMATRGLHLGRRDRRVRRRARPRRLPHPRRRRRRRGDRRRWPSARSSRSGRPCGSRCATRRARGRTSPSCSTARPTRRAARCCSPATGAAPRCSRTPTTTSAR